MTKEKQIEEMVIALTESQHEFDKAWHECLHNGGKQPDRENVFYAKFLLDKGYRLATDVAREIFEELDRMCIDIFGNFNHRVFAELKKKYESEDTE